MKCEGWILQTLMRNVSQSMDLAIPIQNSLHYLEVDRDRDRDLEREGDLDRERRAGE